jgi:glycosyltransferase involved in cell wall biosynthesis
VTTNRHLAPAPSTGFVSVLVCTRNRPDALVRIVRSLLAPSGDSFELIVIDQSDGSRSWEVLGRYRSDPRLRYVACDSRGKGAALNEGLRLAAGDIVVCTDDDCEAPGGWAADMARVMIAHPTAAIVFCNVTGGPYDARAGYVPMYQQAHDRMLSSIIDARHGLGLGAGMAVRRKAVIAFGGFDEAFGPGARFASGDDWDLSLRALARGWHVYDTSCVSILHHGYRTLAEGRDHAVRDWVAIGALCAKPIRAGHLNAIVVSTWLFWSMAVWPALRDVARLRRPSGRSRIVGFVRGFSRGLRIPLDRRTLLFRTHG